MVLKNGITIKSFAFNQVFVEKLYLKLDNKLQLNLESITIKQSKTDESIDWFYIIEAVELFPVFFEKVLIEKFNISANNYDYTLKVLYEDKTFSVDSNDIYIYSQIAKEQDSIVADPVIHLKNQDIFIFSQLQYNPFSLKASAKAKFHWHDAVGDISFSRIGKDVDIKIKSQEFTNLKDIFDNFGLHETINAWTYDYIKASKYKLEYMTFSHRLDEKFDFYNLKAKAVAQNVNVTFHNKVKPVNIKEVELFFNEGKLLFNLKDPVYEGKDLNGSFVYISDLIDEKDDFIVVDIKTNAKYDKSIEDILNAYGIDVLVKQKSGTVDANVILNILFKNGNTTATGSFKAKNAVFDFLGYLLQTKDAKVNLNDNIITFEDIKIKDKNQSFQTTGFIDTDTKKAKLNFDVDFFDKYYLNVKNETFDTLVDFNDNVKISIPHFNTFMNINDDFSAKITNIHNLIKYIPKLQFKFYSGTVEVKSNDFINYQAGVKANIDQNYFLNENYIKNIDLNISYNKNTNQTIINHKNKVKFDKNNNLLTINDYTLDLSPALKADMLKNNDGLKLFINGNNSSLKIDANKLVMNNYRLHIDNSNISLNATHNNATLKFNYHDDFIETKAYNLKDKTLHPLLNFDGIKNGKYHFDVKGNIDSLNGKITIEGGTLTNMKTYNNLIALINTIPSLAIFKNPGFNEEGLSINKGEIEFLTFEKKIYITKLFINGKSSDIEGFGYIDLEKKTLEIDLKVKTIRELGSVMSKIPLAGYIIFGDDKSLAFSAKVSGTLDDPRVTTQTANELLQTPYNLIKRTIQSPYKLLEDMFFNEK